MPDPDLPPIVLTNDYINEVEKEMPRMPDAWRDLLKGDLGLDAAQTETLLDANADLASERYLHILDEVLADKDFAKQLANWFVNIDVPFIRERGEGARVDRLPLYQAVNTLVKDGKLSSTNAKALITDLLALETLPEDIAAYAQEKGYIQVSDEGAIAEIVKTVLEQNAKAAEDVKSGEMKAIGFLVGQVMKQSQGKANPQMAQDLIKKQLGL